MFKSLSFIVVVAMVFVVTTTNQAQAWFDSTKVGGYVMLRAPHDSVKTFTNRWSVVKITGYSSWVIGEFQYDFASNYLISAQGRISRRVLGGAATLDAGRVFTAAGQITPAPNRLNGKLWLAVFNSYSFIEDGVGLEFARGPFNLYVVCGNSFSAATTYSLFQAELQLLWQEDFAKTIAINTPKINNFGVEISVFAGATFYNGNRSEQLTVVYNADYKNGRIYFGGDGGDIQALVGGGRYDFSESVRVKYQYNFTKEEHFTEVVFSF